MNKFWKILLIVLGVLFVLIILPLLILWGAISNFILTKNSNTAITPQNQATVQQNTNSPIYNDCLANAEKSFENYINSNSTKNQDGTITTSDEVRKMADQREREEVDICRKNYLNPKR